MVRDLHEPTGPAATATEPSRGARERDPTADLDPEDLVLKDDEPKRAPSAAGRATGVTGGRAAMGMLAWVMMGLAIWHFTIFLPDRFWGGIVGAFLGALIGAVLFGFIINGFTIPGQDDTHVLPGPRGDPGRADRHRPRVLRGRPPRLPGARSVADHGAGREHRGDGRDAHRGDPPADDLGALSDPLA